LEPSPRPCGDDCPVTQGEPLDHEPLNPMIKQCSPDDAVTARIHGDCGGRRGAASESTRAAPGPGRRGSRRHGPSFTPMDRSQSRAIDVP
jgi:hypothetical protein